MPLTYPLVSIPQLDIHLKNLGKKCCFEAVLIVICENVALFFSPLLKRASEWSATLTGAIPNVRGKRGMNWKRGFKRTIYIRNE